MHACMYEYMSVILALKKVPIVYDECDVCMYVCTVCMCICMNVCTYVQHPHLLAEFVDEGLEHGLAPAAGRGGRAGGGGGGGGGRRRGKRRHVLAVAYMGRFELLILQTNHLKYIHTYIHDTMHPQQGQNPKEPLYTFKLSFID